MRDEQRLPFRVRLAFMLVDVVRLVVPRSRRERWRQEWRAELLSRATDRARSDSPQTISPFATARALVSHAWVLLQQSWNLDTVSQDLRYGIRRLRRSPGYTLVAILTIAVGIGANTAIFSVVNSTLLRPLPFPDGERVRYLWRRSTRMDLLSSPRIAEVEEWRENAELFEQFEFFTHRSYTLTGGDEPAGVSGFLVSPDLFTFLRAEPRIGRAFVPEDGADDAPGVVILSDATWRARFGSDPEILGRQVALDGEPHTVVGVLAPKFPFRGPFHDPQVWVPMSAAEAAEIPGVFVLARLREGVTTEAANAEIQAISHNLDLETGLTSDVGDFSLHAQSLSTQYGEAFRTSILAMQAAVALVLLIAVANVANLALARGRAREREVAIRAAIGAGRSRLLRQLLTEHVLVAAAGGVVGLGLARVGVEILAALRPDRIAGLANVRVDGDVLAFAALITLLAGLAFGAAPALRGSRADLVAGIAGARRGRRSRRSGRGWLRGSLVVVEIALSMVLLIGAGLLIRTVISTLQTDLGFRPAGLVSVTATLPEDRFAEDSTRAQFADDLFARARRAIGDDVVSLSMGTAAPPHGSVIFGTFSPVGREAPPEFNNAIASTVAVRPGYFQTLGIPLLEGRDFEAEDLLDERNVAIVNETWARWMWPGEDPVGQRIEIGGSQDGATTVIGVAGNVSHHGFNSSLGDLQIYFPFGAGHTVALIARVPGDPYDVVARMTEQIHAIDPDVPVGDVASVEDRVRATVAPQRFNAAVMATFAGLALLLALIGVYGLLSYTVARRRREIGIRVALGARAGSVLGLVMRQGMTLTLTGIVLGIGGALAVARTIESLLYGVEPFDLGTYLAVAGILVAVAFVACIVPARRAARVDPMTALRTD